MADDASFEAPATVSAPMPPAIARAVNSIMKAVRGVAKGGRNVDQKYDYTRVEDLLGKIQPAMAEAGLLILPSEKRFQVLADTGLLIATYSFRLAHVGGDIWSDELEYSGMATFRFKSGGTDDKALNKCGTAARKYFLLSLFQIPTGLPDADRDDDTTKGARKKSAQAKRDGDDVKIREAIKANQTLTDLAEWDSRFDQNTAHLPASWLDSVRDEVLAWRDELAQQGTAWKARERELDDGFKDTMA
jgi:hypothetical protein